MIAVNRLIAIAIIYAVLTSSVAAQTSDDYHPFLSNKFNLAVGIFYPQINFTAQVDGSSTEDEIDLDQALNLGDSQSTGAISFRWRFGEKWSLWGQAWTTDHSGGAVLEEDVEWEDFVFKEGIFANAGVELDIVRCASNNRTF